ncbi:asparaginase [Pluteus cervinus]|uniref:Asparaginase n=1 Tax=Pluteus cervinus TaxID=181527 RepID=A0ACD3BBV4_9AGAR|nr:asparaginase [Pluteus cervinus]
MITLPSVHFTPLSPSLLEMPEVELNASPVLVIHGGAGTMSKEGASPERRAQFKAALAEALKAGHLVLQGGGEAMDAAVAAVNVMEDDPLFNAGKGAVFNMAGKNELEASIMLSKPPASHPEIPVTRHGIGATLLTHVRNPATLARELYLSPSLAPHTFLSGATAEDVGKELGVTVVDPSYYYTKHRWLEHRKGLELPTEDLPIDEKIPLDDLPRGTVGAVALDARGCIVAVTSTGGRTNKLVGRIGDTPMMGAGYWAEEWTSSGFFQRALNKVFGKSNHRAVGISGTGDGDYFIRLGTASTVARRMQYLNETVQEASAWAVEELRAQGGIGGVIALDAQGEVGMPLNCSGMYRGVIRSDGIPKTAIFDDDLLS